ncbi:MAG: hypothetical protein WA717_09870 [Methyloceanibacter sp.]
MSARPWKLLTLAAALVAVSAGVARAQEIETCYATADRVTNGDTVSAEDKDAGHKACQAALEATSSIVQKSQIQDADFDIIGRPAKQPD